jgi:uncharacterized protein (TIGR03437 family)
LIRHLFVRSFLMAVFVTCAVTASGASLPSPWSPAQGVRDAQGNLYVAGSVANNSIPVTAGAFQTNFNSAICGYIGVSVNGTTTEEPVACQHLFAAKLSPDGSTILLATYIEGSQSETTTSYVVDQAGHLFISGSTDSPDFPVTGTLSILPPPGSSGNNSFVLELAADGSQLVFSHKFGVSLGEGIYGSIGSIGLDGQGGFYVAGVADGTAFPTTPGAFMHDHNPASTDVFVFKLDIASDSIVYSTLFGGSDEEELASFAVDTAGNIYVAGYTLSQDLPVTSGSYQVPGPLINIFVAKLNPSGSSLVFSSLFAGSSDTYLGPMGVDAGGSVYIGGADSLGVLQTSPGAFQSPTTNHPLGVTSDVSGGQGYVAKFDSATGARVFLTYLADGGANFEGLIAPAADGSVWISLQTAGPGLSRPLIMSPDALAPCVPGGLIGAAGTYPYVKHISADGTQQLYGTFLSGIASLSGDGTVQVYNPTSGFQTIDLTAPQPPHLTCVANAATFLGQGIAPGEAVTIFGPGIGPDQPESYQLTSAGTVSTNLGGLQVEIGGLAAPILYASNNQINAIVPFGAPTEGSVSVVVTSPGESIASLTTTAISSNPGIFTADGSGTGGQAAFNADGSLNSQDNPAAAGSFVTIYATGLGPMSPTPVDGSIPQAPTSQATLPVQVYGTYNYPILQFNVQYAGDVVGAVEGIRRINIAIPDGGSTAAISDWFTLSVGQTSTPISNQVSVYFY